MKLERKGKKAVVRENQKKKEKNTYFEEREMDKNEKELQREREKERRRERDKETERQRKKERERERKMECLRKFRKAETIYLCPDKIRE